MKGSALLLSNVRMVCGPVYSTGGAQQPIEMLGNPVYALLLRPGRRAVGGAPPTIGASTDWVNSDVLIR